MVKGRFDRVSKTKKGEQSVLCVTHRLYLLHISIKLHEDIINSELVIECTRMKLHKISTKTQSKSLNF